MKRTLFATMLILTLALAGCGSNRTVTDRDAANHSTSASDYEADENGSVTPKDYLDDDVDENEESDAAIKNNQKNKTNTNTDKENEQGTLDRVGDDVESAADNVVDAADDVVDGAANAVEGGADGAEDVVTGDNNKNTTKQS